MPTTEIYSTRSRCAQIEAINVSLLKLPPKPVEHTPLGPQLGHQ
jgi:hypothetical protein